MSQKTTEEILKDIFQTLKSSPPKEMPRFKVAIISTPRCGSSLFCDVLANTGEFGWPLEWFNTRYMQAYGQVLGLKQVDFNNYLNWVMARSSTANGVFSVNFHVEQYQLLHSKGLDVMKLGFDRVYYLQRRDKLAQAYSLHRAQVTDQWSSNTQAKPGFKESQVQNSHIIKALFQLAQSDELYEKDLARYIHRAFDYEDFSRLMETSAFDCVLADCGLQPLNRASLNTTMERQSNDNTPEPLARIRTIYQPSQAVNPWPGPLNCLFGSFEVNRQPETQAYPSP